MQQNFDQKIRLFNCSRFEYLTWWLRDSRPRISDRVAWEQARSPAIARSTCSGILYHVRTDTDMRKIQKLKKRTLRWTLVFLCLTRSLTAYLKKKTTNRSFNWSLYLRFDWVLFKRLQKSIKKKLKFPTPKKLLQKCLSFPDPEF